MIVSGKTSLPQAAWDIRKPLIWVVLASAGVVIGDYVVGERWVSLDISLLTSLGVALSVFLSFRNNVVYDRYWEGRILWGRMVNVSRTLSRQAATFVANDAEAERLMRTLGRQQTAFVHAFRAHLRDDDEQQAAAPFLSPGEVPELGRNVPAAILHNMGQTLRQAWKAGYVSDFHLTQLDNSLTEITTILGGCERIKNTPLPPAYTYLAHKVVLAYCCIVPFGLIGELHFLTPVLAIIVGFAFLTLDHISELIEQPFARDANDLPLSGLSRTIENDIRERTRQEVLPALEPEEGVLL